MPSLYFKNVSTGGEWENAANWFEDDACTIAYGTTHATTAAPWQEDNAYKSWDLTRSSDSIAAEDYVYINAPIGDGFEITGTCDIGLIGSGGAYGFISNNGSYIYGGTFSGGNFFNNGGSIYGGTFSGEYFSNDYGGYIYGGTFSGGNFSNFYGSIYGGTFSGANFSNDYGSYIYGGTFSGADFFNNGGSIYGGTFSGEYFSNYGSYIYGGTFSGGNFSNNGSYIYGGTFSGANFSNYGGYIYGGYWLESGTMDVDSFDFNTYSPIIITTRISGSSGNPYPVVNGGDGFSTLRIAGQDVLGTGLL